MENKILNNDKAFLKMQEAIEVMNEDERHIADLMRELETTKLKKADDFKKVRQYSANYYTKEKISEINRLSSEVLKSTYFDEEIYIEKFSDSEKIKLDDIHFLNNILNNIIEVQDELNSDDVLPSNDQSQDKLGSKIMSAVADIFSRKDGAK